MTISLPWIKATREKFHCTRCDEEWEHFGATDVDLCMDLEVFEEDHILCVDGLTTAENPS